MHYPAEMNNLRNIANLRLHSFASNQALYIARGVFSTLPAVMEGLKTGCSKPPLNNLLAINSVLYYQLQILAATIERKEVARIVWMRCSCKNKQCPQSPTSNCTLFIDLSTLCPSCRSLLFRLCCCDRRNQVWLFKSFPH